MSKIKIIRPSQLLGTFNKMELSKKFSCEISDGDIGSTTMLEKLVMVLLGRLINVNKVFEFGTFKGETTKVFLVNKIGSKVSSIDLPYSYNDTPIENFDLNKDIENDQYLTKIRHSNVDNELYNFADKLEMSLELIKKNSLNFDISGRENSYDLIFIDGGHTLELIENDTNLSLSMLSKNGCILWHDYGSKIHTAVTKYIDELSETRDLFLIGDTSLILYTRNDFLFRALSANK